MKNDNRFDKFTYTTNGGISITFENYNPYWFYSIKGVRSVTSPCYTMSFEKLPLIIRECIAGKKFRYQYNKWRFPRHLSDNLTAILEKSPLTTDACKITEEAMLKTYFVSETQKPEDIDASFALSVKNCLLTEFRYLYECAETRCFMCVTEIGIGWGSAIIEGKKMSLICLADNLAKSNELLYNKLIHNIDWKIIKHPVFEKIGL